MRFKREFTLALCSIALFVPVANANDVTCFGTAYWEPKQGSQASPVAVTSAVASASSQYTVSGAAQQISTGSVYEGETEGVQNQDEAASQTSQNCQEISTPELVNARLCVPKERNAADNFFNIIFRSINWTQPGGSACLRDVAIHSVSIEGACKAALGMTTSNGWWAAYDDALATSDHKIPCFFAHKMGKVPTPTEPTVIVVSDLQLSLLEAFMTELSQSLDSAALIDKFFSELFKGNSIPDAILMSSKELSLSETAESTSKLTESSKLSEK